jgi:hypothetical protein
MAVDVALLKTIRGLGREQQVVDARALVLGPGAALVIPPSIALGGRMLGPERVGQAQEHHLAEQGAGLDVIERVFFPRLGFVDVLGLGDDVVIAAEDEGILAREQVPDVGVQPLQPGELVGKFLRPFAALGDRVAVGQIDRGDPHALREPLDVAGLGVVRRAGQGAAVDLDRGFGQDRDPVVGLLPDHGQVVAEFLEFERRKRARLALYFLQQ